MTNTCKIFDMTVEEFGSLSSFEQAQLRHRYNPFALSQNELTPSQFKKNKQARLLSTLTNSFSIYEKKSSQEYNNIVEYEVVNGTLDPDALEFYPMESFLNDFKIDTDSLETKLRSCVKRKQELSFFILDIKRLQKDFKKEPWQLHNSEYGFDYETGDVVPYKNQLQQLQEQLEEIELVISQINLSISQEKSTDIEEEINEEAIQEVDQDIFSYLLKETTEHKTYYRTIQTH